MEFKHIHRIFAILAFVTAAVVYMMTVQPSVPFWDCGEFSAASIWQQVPHPPGAPLFLMLGKLFHIIIPFGDPGWRVNLVSVFSSAFIILLLYLIGVKVIRNFRSEPIETTGDALAIYGSAFVGSLALIFSDTFWFNAVESEVYALSALFVALLIYLMMKWNEVADEPGNERYLLLMAYLIGLSTGVHLLAVLTVFAIVFLVYFRKYKLTYKSFILTGIISVVMLYIIYPGIVKYIPALLAGHTPWRNAAREYLIEDSTVLTFFTITAVLATIFILYKGLKNKKHVVNLAASALLLMLLGYTTYTQILIRSNANPPMNENEPKNLAKLTAYLGREQYGDDPAWPRRFKSDEYYTRYYTKKDASGEYVYGKWYPPKREPVYRKDGTGFTIPVFKKVNFMGEMMYMLKYQINHMYFRYFYWNFVGRMSDTQEAPAAFFNKSGVDELNYNSGYKDLFPIRFFMLPLLFGLIGMIFHFWRDPKMAFLFLITFLLMGVLAAIAQQQQMPQPRERDYFYTGSFLVWCMWIGLGTYGIIEWLAKKKKTPAITASVVAMSILLVPVNMAVGGWKMHDRSGNYIPFDYSYNILQSTEKNAIIFTNGDNDTFPLWYLQDVAGVRRDVRVVNLSLGNTLWYVDQLKNRSPWGSEKIPLSFADDSLQVDELNDMALNYDFGEAHNISIPVDRKILAEYTNDSAIIAGGTMNFKHIGKPYQKMEGKQIYLFRIQDKLVLDILQRVRFTRPVYFSTTVGPDAFCGLEPFFRYEGMAMRICPVKQKTSNLEPFQPEIMWESLMNVDNSNNYHKEPHYGFKLRNLNDPSIYYDEVHRRLMMTYRHLFASFASYMKTVKNDSAKTIEILNQMNNMISTVQFPMTFDMEYRVAKLYDDCGDKEQANKMYDLCLKSSLELVNNNDLQPDIILYEAAGRYVGPYRYASRIYARNGNYVDAKDVLQKLLTLSEELKRRYQNAPGYEQEASKMEYNIFDIKMNIDKYSIAEFEKDGDLQGALDKAKSIYQGYAKSKDPAQMTLGRYVADKIKDLESKLGAADTSASLQ